jgi:hypothetical protein
MQEARDQGSLTIRRAEVAGLDRLLPARAGPFLGAVATVGALVWVAGLLLAGERQTFLESREWKIQPLYLAVHLVLLRMFVSAYSGNFLAGCGALDTDRADVERRLRRVLGVFSVAGAFLLAVPLIGLDVAYLRSDRHLGAGLALGEGHTLGAADWLMAGVWSVEWVINAYVWLVIVGALVLTQRVLRRHGFRDPIERVLRERQYRPFLLMSAQGASLTVVLAVAIVSYIVVTEGATSDYVGLWVAGGLVMLGFVPPWLTLKARLGRGVDAEAMRLGASLDASTAALGTGARAPAASTGDVGARVDLVLDLVRFDHLKRLHEELGRSEAQGLVLKLLVPAATGGWRFLRPFFDFLP